VTQNSYQVLYPGSYRVQSGAYKQCVNCTRTRVGAPTWLKTHLNSPGLVKVFVSVVGSFVQHVDINLLQNNARARTIGTASTSGSSGSADERTRDAIPWCFLAWGVCRERFSRRQDRPSPLRTWAPEGRLLAVLPILVKRYYGDGSDRFAIARSVKWLKALPRLHAAHSDFLVRLLAIHDASGGMRSSARTHVHSSSTRTVA
jgi:hypothetical protein